MIKFFTGVFATIALGIVVYTGAVYVQPKPEPSLAGGAVTKVSNPWTFQDDVTFTDPIVADEFTQGGTQVSTSTVSASFGALTEAQLLASSIILLTPNVSSATSTLPATSTMTTLLASNGDTRSWTLVNGTSTASKWVGIAAGTGIDLDAVTLNNVQINPNASALLSCVRMATTDVRCRVLTFVVGD